LPIDFADAKPLWAALYQFLNPMNTRDYEHRRSSIYEIWSRCDELIMRSKLLIQNEFGGQGGS
jgi:hypothetical protein